MFMNVHTNYKCYAHSCRIIGIMLYHTNCFKHFTHIMIASNTILFTHFDYFSALFWRHFLINILFIFKTTIFSKVLCFNHALFSVTIILPFEFFLSANDWDINDPSQNFDTLHINGRKPKHKSLLSLHFFC